MTACEDAKIALDPCPFCGGEARIERYGDRRQSTQYACDECGCSLETGEEWGHGRGWNRRAPLAPDLATRVEENETLRARLRSVTDTLASLLKDGMPSKGRGADDLEAKEAWIEDAVQRTQSAYAALAGVSLPEWLAAHPALYLPPPGPIVASADGRKETHVQN